MTRSIIATLFILATFSVAPAIAAPSGIAVAYGDLDLSASAGQSELQARLHDAAAKLCSPVLAEHGSDQSVREFNGIYQACIGRLSRRAMVKVNSARN